MTTKLVATLLLAGGLLATTGIGLTQAPGDGAPAERVAPKPATTEQAVRAALARSCGLKSLDHMTLDGFVAQLEVHLGVAVRFDLAAYKRLDVRDVAPEGEQVTELNAAVFKKLYEFKLAGNFSGGVPLAEVLSDVCAQLPGRHSYRVRNGQVLIGPAYLPPAIPGRLAERGGEPGVEVRRLLEQIHGEPVSLSIEERPFLEAVKELRRLTGANIVVNTAADKLKDKATLVSATFDDVRLYTALELLGDMVGLKLVYVNNVYYLTSPESAEKLQKKVNEELYVREAKPLIVAGYLTDGVNFYRNPGNLKPEEPFGGICVVGSVPAGPAPKK